MILTRQLVIRLFVALVLAATLPLTGYATSAARPKPQAIVSTWNKLILELVRHTPTYSPPVASRSFAYIGVAAYEAAASGPSALHTLAGQLNGLTPGPQRVPGQVYDEAVVVQATLANMVKDLFANTGPSGHRAMTALEAKLAKAIAADVPADVLDRSTAYGRAVARHILEWSRSDGGAVIENMGFPYEYTLASGPSNWVPTNTVAQQQKPLLPQWGANRTFAMPDGKACGLPPPPEYSEAPESDFYKEALEVYKTTSALSPDQRAIARFWSDDPMLSPTPPGHWMSIAIQALEHENADFDKSVEVLALLGISTADAFIGCWHSKFEFDLLRPVTYIHRLIDSKWEPLLITPPFPEYPSGHSTQSGAAAEVLTHAFGDTFAFEDTTAKREGLPSRSFDSFWAAAQEAGMSRLYGGIHFRSAIERGLEQGRCIGAYVIALKTRR